jgi:hypothetical protein
MYVYIYIYIYIYHIPVKTQTYILLLLSLILAFQTSFALFSQTWILKVSLHCEGCKRKVKKVLQSIDGTNQKYENPFAIWLLRKLINAGNEKVLQYLNPTPVPFFLFSRRVAFSVLLFLFLFCYFAGVFTTAFDSQQQKVTVTGNVAVETLIRKLLKTGKHAEIWPENIAGKEKKSGRAKSKDKDSDPESNINDNGQKDENPCEKAEEKFSSVKNSGKESGGNSPENPPAGDESPTLDQKGSESTKGGAAGTAAKGGGKKMKRKGQKGNNVSSGLPAPLFGNGTPAGTGSQSHELDTNHGVGLMNLNPTRHSSSHYPQGNYTQVQPVYVASYSRTHPTPSFGPSCFAPSSPYTYAGTHQEIYPVQATPLDSFEIFSDENADGCSIM